MLDLGLEGITEPNTREALYTIVEEWRSQPQLNFLWKFYSVTFSSGGTFTFLHNLGFIPLDYQITNSSAASGDIDLTTATNTTVDIEVSEACTMRFLLGRLDVNSQV